MSRFEFQETTTGTTALDSFLSLIGLVNEDENYDGMILTCDFGECTLKFDKYNEDNEEKAQKHIEEMNYGEECVANYVDLGIAEYEVITIKKEKEKSDNKFNIKYVIVEKDIIDEEIQYIKTEYSSYDLEEIENKAIELALETENEFKIIKEYVVCEGYEVESIIKVEKKVYNEKPEIKENQRLIEKHKYIFYGIATN